MRRTPILITMRLTTVLTLLSTVAASWLLVLTAGYGLYKSAGVIEKSGCYEKQIRHAGPYARAVIYDPKPIATGRTVTLPIP